MTFCSIPPDVAFLPALAEWWLEGIGDDPLAIAEGLILLPTRRAARALADEFLRAGKGRSMLLPRIMAIGGMDEAPLALADALAIPPAVAPAQRLAVLTRFILALRGENGAPRSADGAWRLAAELAVLMDEAERSQISLADRLGDAAGPDHAEHWNRTVDFLAIVTRHWPLWLAEQGFLNPVARQVALLDAQAAAWRERPPSTRVVLAGIASAHPSLTDLAKVIASLPAGLVILPGLDRDLTEGAWETLEESHPQAGMRRLLADVGARREDVAVWRPYVPGGRVALLSRALLPAAALGAWQNAEAADLQGLFRIDPADQQEEAVAIALLLREALERPHATAALVTPDRDLAIRVSAELLRYGVVADDSAGEPIAQTPPAVFLRLLAEAVADDLAPVKLLALLKNPFAAAGLAPAAARAAARAFDVQCLRGPRPPAGLAGLRRAVDKASGPAPAMLLARLEKALDPLLRLARAAVAAPGDLLDALVRSAEALAATDTTPGPAILWAGEEGEALADLLLGVQEALVVLPDTPPGVLPRLLEAVMQGQVVRSRRALRGREGEAHPRVFIWGRLEARLQSVDRLVLGGLAEGVWPPATDPGPWLSRPMRGKIGLPSPEEQVGDAAHDFVAAVCAAREVVLSCPRRRDNAPAVPSRWLVRLEACLKGSGQRLPVHPASAWASRLDQPAGEVRPAAPPRPCPAVALRPRKLSVTEVETWLRDPYAIYARHVLRLRALEPLEKSADAADFGMVVHAGLQRFVAEYGVRWPPDAPAKLRLALELELRQAGLRPALQAWWGPRLARIAEWVAEQETARFASDPPVAIATEVKGEWRLDVPAGFLLHGRADRIERGADGRLLILDYKTGTVPSENAVKSGLAPQLPLEAAMAAHGAFPGFAGETKTLLYWHISGGMDAGKAHTLLDGNAADLLALAGEAENNFRALIEKFDDPRQPYLSQPHPDSAPRFSDYAQLARVSEWSGVEDEA